MRPQAGLVLSAVVVALVAAGCRRAAPPAAPQPATPPAAAAAPVVAVAAVNPHREEAREILTMHCGKCHRSDLPTAKAKALAVYDLTEADWSARMSRPQLEDALGRLRKNSDVPKGEAERFAEFVTAERARRDAEGYEQ
jgi:hypothetical protein